ARSPRGHQPVTFRSIMPIEHLTCAQIAGRLSVSTEAARAIVKRHRVPRSRSNDGKTLAAIDLQEIRHKPLPASSPTYSGLMFAVRMTLAHFSGRWPETFQTQLANSEVAPIPQDRRGAL